jgi:hypothetical protein
MTIFASLHLDVEPRKPKSVSPVIKTMLIDFVSGKILLHAQDAYQDGIEDGRDEIRCKLGKNRENESTLPCAFFSVVTRALVVVLYLFVSCY